MPGWLTVGHPRRGATLRVSALGGYVPLEKAGCGDSVVIGGVGEAGDPALDRVSAPGGDLLHLGEFGIGAGEADPKTLELSADTGLTLTAYTAELGSALEDALKLLASWAATHDQAATTRPTDSASP
jgi:hypothetical protein